MQLALSYYISASTTRKYSHTETSHSAKYFYKHSLSKMLAYTMERRIKGQKEQESQSSKNDLSIIPTFKWTILQQDE